MAALVVSSDDGKPLGLTGMPGGATASIAILRAICGFPAFPIPQPMSDPPFLAPDVGAMNRILPAYEFLTAITSNGRRAVYLVNQKSLDRKAAIKVYSPHLSRDPAFRESFSATAKKMASVKHVNLIGVYDSGIERNMLYLVTEFVPGKPLWNSAKGEAIDMQHVRGLIKGIAEGVCHAHRNGVHHGALSLTNILLDENRTPKIGGFSQGIEDGDKIEVSSLRFRAPELATPGAEVTAQADIYSMGAILRELAVGANNKDERALSKIEGGSRALQELCAKATALDPDKRHATAEEFRDELIDALEGRGSRSLVGGARLGGGPKRPTVGMGAAKGGAAKRAAAVRPVAAASSNAKLWLNIVIIIILLVAIKIAWGAYSDKKRKQRERESAKMNPADATKVIRVPRSAPRPVNRPQSEPWDPSAGTETTPSTPSTYRPVVEQREDATVALAPLRESLLSGARNRLPAGTVASGNSYFFHVNVRMTWNDAFWFAINHGAHLAVPDKEATIQWMCEKLVPEGESAFWIGAAKSGRDLWTLADGRPWQVTNPSLSKGDFIAVGADKSLQSFNDAAKLSFVIQWSNDGSNPGSIEALLERTRESLSTSNPVYPPGTQAFGVRHYLYVPQPVNWKDAVLKARSSGGHLMVATSIVENFHLEKMTNGIEAPDGIWIGGFHLADKGWRWTTGEAWKSSDWPQDKPAEVAEAAIAVLPGGKWIARSRLDVGSGYLIEWSKDSVSGQR